MLNERLGQFLKNKQDFFVKWFIDNYYRSVEDLVHRIYDLTKGNPYSF